MRARFTITVIGSAFRGAVIGRKCSIATSMTNGSIPTRRAIPAASRLRDRDGTDCRAPQELHYRQTLFWYSRATGEISGTEGCALVLTDFFGFQTTTERPKHTCKHASGNFCARAEHM